MIKNIINNTIVWITSAVLSVIFLANLIFSYPDFTSKEFIKNTPIIIALGIICLCFIFIVLLRLISKFNLKIDLLYKMLIIYTVFICLFVVFLFVAPQSTFWDQYAAANGVYRVGDGYGMNTYIEHFPQQIGLTLLYQLIFKIFGSGAFFVMYFVNIVSIILITYLIPKITRLMTKSEVSEIIAILSMFVFIPLIMMVNFLYNDLIAIALALFAVYHQFIFLKNKSISSFILSSFSISIALIYRSNLLFVLIGMIFLYTYKIFERKLKARFTVALIVFVISLQITLHFGVSVIYSYREGLSESPLYWIAMSLQDEESLGGGLSFAQPGMWNAYSTKAFEEFRSADKVRNRGDYYNSSNKEEVVDIYKKDIIERLAWFKDNPLKAVIFFAKRLVATWADASFTTEKNNEIISHTQKSFIEENFYAYSQFSGIHESKVATIGNNAEVMQSRLHKSIVNGRINWIIQNLINKPFVILVFLFAILGVFYRRKGISTEELMLLIVFLGGFLFHEFIWESRSRYIIFEFIFLIPIAVYAAGEAYKLYCRLYERLK